jgi:glycosyltransferase involved in cell wall biosynthesis
MLISVIVTCHNAEDTIGDALASVARQTRLPDEVIVVDDGSSDGSLAAIARHAPDAQVIAQENRGVSSARNAGIAAARGDLIAFLDDDDTWHPTKLARQVEVLARHPGLDLLATSWSRAEPVPAPDAPLRWLTRLDLAIMNQFQTSTVLVRRTLLDRTGGFQSMLDGVEDWACWLACARSGSLAILDTALVRYRDSPQGLSKDLGRFYRTMRTMMDRTDLLVFEDHETTGVLRAWHLQRLIVATLLARQQDRLWPMLLGLVDAEPGAHWHALRQLTLPYLQERLARRRAR